MNTSTMCTVSLLVVRDRVMSFVQSTGRPTPHVRHLLNVQFVKLQNRTYQFSTNKEVLLNNIDTDSACYHMNDPLLLALSVVW